MNMSTKREVYEQRDAEIRTEIRKQYKHDGEFRHAKEWAEVLGRPLGQVQGSLNRLRIAGGISERRGRRPRHNREGAIIGTFAVREYGPTRDDLRMTILALEASTRLALSAADAAADRGALRMRVTRRKEPSPIHDGLMIDAVKLDLYGGTSDWRKIPTGDYLLVPIFDFELKYRGPGFKVEDPRPGHRIELDSFLEAGH